MRILQLHNHYGSHSGESTVLDVHAALLKSHGHSVSAYTRSSVELESIRFGKALAFFTALWNPASTGRVRRAIEQFRPDVVHIHNLYPLLSPSVLPVIHRSGVPIVMTVHNYRLLCPNGLFYNKQGICERCSGGREWNCVRSDCEESVPKSLGYAARNAWARVAGYYSNNVDAFLFLTEFQMRKHVENGFPAEKCHVLPNFIESESGVVDGGENREKRNGFFFIGRLNRQKGIDILVQAAAKCPDVAFTLAGSADSSFIDTGALPPNVKWLGVINDAEKVRAFRKAEALVFTSRSYEGFPMVFLEAMQQHLPVVAPKLAGYPEIIREGCNGWLYRPEDVFDLANTIKEVDNNPLQAREYGKNGSEILRKEYSSDIWYRAYMEVVSSLRQTANNKEAFPSKTFS
ncbi:MAG: glycosyltransferase family 4 protein [Chlorobium limicola]|uniref:glycosyltransferase family 4 protein n=1 Tax=Chlorobium limicola TaxID=1092 RepID=UPI0023F2CA7A|nr:glycosyltransferase family 4 protein [Chlorobium limicola]NTV20916.1 glycosyltransferase family 4 protein [Chlorobium limicola]